MMLFLNMTARVTLGNVFLGNLSEFKINENILEMSNTATIIIPKNYAKLNNKPILEHFQVGDKVLLEAGYNGQLAVEFTGYIREIESDAPVIIHCDDETFPLRQTNYIKSYRDATLDEILNDIIPKNIKFEAPEVHIGKYQIDNASAFTVLCDLMKHYGLYSRLQNGTLRIGLAYDFGLNTQNHEYAIGKNVRKNNLKYKRQEDFRVRYKAIANNPDGTKTEVTVGDMSIEASERTLNFAGPMTEEQLRENAISVMAKVVYDGYTGSITGFGLPRTHAGDSLTLKDEFAPEREGTYLIEKVDVRYNQTDGFSRENTLSYKI